MSIIDKLNEYKIVIGLVTAVVVATVGVITWAADTKEELIQQQQQAIVLTEAKATLIHNDYYQEGRIARKEDQVNENKRELDNLLDYVGENEPTPRQAREIEYLDTEIARLRQDIENIRVELAQANE